MAGIQDFWEFKDDFFGGGTLAASGQGDPWVLTDTSSSGTPTYVYTDGDGAGAVTFTHDNTSEVQIVRLSFGDVLAMNLPKIQGAAFRVKMGQAAVNAATSLQFGLMGDANATHDSIAQHISFRVVGAGSTTAVVVETDDGTTDNDDVATGQVLINAYKTFKIDLSHGLSDVRFFMSDASGSLTRVAQTTTFDVSAYTGSVQPYFNLQKSAATSTDSAVLDYVHVWGKR